MADNGRIAEELYALRDRLRRENSRRGRSPQICTDSAIEQMAAKPPSREQDLLAVEGFGETSAEKYGADFLRVTRKYIAMSANGQGTDPETSRALKEMQKRLVNLSRGNRMLFMPRTGTGVSCDVGGRFGASVTELITHRKGTFSVPKNDPSFRRMGSVMREVNRDLREHGVYDLYIGYPFAEGTLKGSDGFQIRAPLALFPVTADKDADGIRVSYDESRDAVFNTTLVLAAMKASGTKMEIGDAVIEEGDLGTLIQAFYSRAGLDLRLEGDVVPFTEYAAGSFPAGEEGVFSTVPSAVFGKFPSYSSMVERDVDLIINGGESNANMRELLKGVYSGDFRSELPHPLTYEQLRDRGIIPSEQSLFRINDLDGQQETALAASSSEDGLVIQGPPGTGKSQVVTAMIASAAASGKRVLMVSDKRTALDVVRSRLGPLQRYAMQVDDAADKERFFANLREVMASPPAGRTDDIGDLRLSVDREIWRLRDISDAPFDPGSLGICPDELRRMVGSFGDDTGDAFGRPSPTLMSLSDGDMQRMISRFSEGRLTRSLKAYDDMLSKHPWAEYLRTDLTEKDLGAMAQELGEIYLESSSASKKGFFGRIFARGSLSRRQSQLAERYLRDYTRSDVEDLTSDPESAVEFLEEYDMFQSYQAVRASLTAEERQWWRGMASVSKKTGIQHPDSARVLREIVLREHLRIYDEKLPDIIAGRDGFASGTVHVQEAMDRVRDASRAVAQNILSGYVDGMKGLRRYADMERIAGQKRKWSVPKFMGRYGYELSQGIRIWLMTPDAVSETLPLIMGDFDLLVFDEASQMFAERGIPSIFRSKKTVVAGDHKQLRPSSLGRGRLSYDEDEDAAENGSLLDLARSRYISVLLNYHYRSENPALIDFSNRAFYGGRLLVAPDTGNGGKAIEVVRTDGVWEERTNRAEAEKAVSLLREILTARKDGETVGIIAFNIHQMNLISDILESECAADRGFGRIVALEESRRDNGEDVGLFVKNVESVQGDERDIVIFSMGYAKDRDGKFSRKFGWLNADGGPNRLNVAITRARKKVVILQSFDPEWLGERDMSGPGLLRRYLEYAACVSSGDTEGAEAALASLSPAPKVPGNDVFARMLAEKLTAEGFGVRTDVPLPAILTAYRQGSRPIAFFRDSDSWNMGGSARERIVHRRRFLISRGWKVEDIWSSDADKEPEKEIERLLKNVL